MFLYICNNWKSKLKKTCCGLTCISSKDTRTEQMPKSSPQPLTVTSFGSRYPCKDKVSLEQGGPKMQRDAAVQGERTPREDGGRAWSEASVSQGRQHGQQPPGARSEAPEVPPSPAADRYRKASVLLTPGCVGWPPELSEDISLYEPVCSPLLWEPQELIHNPIYDNVKNIKCLGKMMKNVRNL